ncbi:teichoic acid transport system permease protein [Brevibacterium iodinum ATCC 49514]|uniref:Teichoic acid transport system permease protein n=1 Tax=Brevibacterium iodinum ATCC 49514 TaxID=1255616 RepID=A0A2H1KI01_9MICO|nr:ABC transporter permease [Brevibacterium iodinum]SMX99395.1 teichoic acid transport system permease protein [Brevibacterium iodinum ATCC 49514]SUW11084.1 ABC-2 type transporter [Brevibacterium iodinum]
MSETKNPLGLSSIPSVSSEGLVPVGRRTSLSSYLAALWNRRHFIIAESRAKMSSSTRKNILGYGWLFLNPLLSVLAFWFIFGFILQTSRGVPNFLGFLVVGVFFFGFTGKCMTGGTGAIRSGASMIKGFQFPRAALPISTVVRNFLDFMPTLLVMVIVLAVVPPLEVITWRVILVIPVIILQTIFNVGLACFLARLGHKIPDLTNFMSIMSRFWLYGSGVFFSIEDRLGKHPLLLEVMQFNPMHAYLTLVRNSLLYGVDSDPKMWIVGSAWAFGLLIFGFLFFWRGEENYGRL